MNALTKLYSSEIVLCCTGHRKKGSALKGCFLLTGVYVSGISTYLIITTLLFKELHVVLTKFNVQGFHIFIEMF
jgi:hypothetical protein